MKSTTATSNDERRGAMRAALNPGFIIGCLALLLGGLALWRSTSGPTVAFVRTQELIYRYAGMKEAQGAFRAKQAAWQQEIDSLEGELRKKVPSDARPASFSAEEQKELVLLRRSIDQHRMNLEKKAAEEDRELTEGVLGQVDALVARYAEEHGYDLIIGTASGGSILHGDAGLDITEDLLNTLNATHAGGGNAQQ